MPSESLSKRSQGGHEYQAVIRCLFERVYSKGELSLVEELVTADFVGDSIESADAYLGSKGVKKHVIRLRTAFHGFTVEIDDLFIEDNTLKVLWTARGTHERRLLGINPTCNIGQVGEEPHGNRFTVSGITTGTIKNGKIDEMEMIWDLEKLCRQLGSSVEDAEFPSSRNSRSHKIVTTTGTPGGEVSGLNYTRLPADSDGVCKSGE